MPEQETEEFTIDPEFRRCWKCGSDEHVVEYHTDGTVHMLCQSCLDELFPMCSECGERHFSRLCHRDGSGDTSRILCESCFQNLGYHVCDECGAFLRNTDPHHVRNGEWFCEHCWSNRAASEVIHEYHPSIEFVPMQCSDEPYEEIHFGCEIEVDDGDKAAALTVDDMLDGQGFLSHDGSLDDGFEIVTMPMTRKYLKEVFPLYEMCKVLTKNGWKSHQTRTCGLHIHMGKPAFGTDRSEYQRTLVNTVYLVEKFFEPLMKFGRRKGNTTYCSPMFGNRYCDQIDYSGIQHRSGHTTVLNLRNDTVELRLFKGTIRPESIEAAVDFYLKIVELAHMQSNVVRNITIDDLWVWLSKSNDNLRDYIERRGFVVPSYSWGDVLIRVEDIDYQRHAEFYESFGQNYARVGIWQRVGNDTRYPNSSVEYGYPGFRNSVMRIVY